jgi:hypothetical protein
MKLLLTICISFFIISCENSISSGKENTKGDTTYVIIDSATINKAVNSFEFVLIFKSEGKSYEILREKNQDYSVEFDKLPFLFKQENFNVEEYGIHDLPTGRDKSIIRNKNKNEFYVTDWYNDNNNADTLKLSSLNFDKHVVGVKGVIDKSYPDYEVTLKKVWEPTEEFKKKTLIKNEID